MKLYRVFSGAAMAISAGLAVFGANAATTVTLNPQAANTGAVGAVQLDSAVSSFTATGLQADLFSTLTLSGAFNTVGTHAFNEVGTIEVTSFSGGLVSAAEKARRDAVGDFGKYRVYAEFSLSGVGAWSVGAASCGVGVAYCFNLVGATFNVDLFGVDASGTNTMALGTAQLAPGAINAVANLYADGTAYTSLGAVLDFTPAAGTSGATGFFQAPSPFSIDFSLGNTGGNTFNTRWSQSGSTVTVLTPYDVNTVNPGTANLTFVAKVPEPSALALVGLALVGVGAASRKSKKHS